MSIPPSGLQNPPDRPHTNLSVDLIDHLSSEIKTLSGYSVAFRTRIAFTFLIGPFTILLALAALSKDARLSQVKILDEWHIILALGVIFIGFGFYGASLEQHASDQCNV